MLAIKVFYGLDMQTALDDANKYITDHNIGKFVIGFDFDSRPTSFQYRLVVKLSII